ncbi:MAG: chromosome partitioning protein ParB, partial [Methylibium sp.]|nr:chromosome partitioning protein ParB [Methylibium sp.]
LLNLAAPVQAMLMAGDLDMGHARALLPLDGATQITTASEIAAKKLSVREAEKLVAKAQGAARQTPLLRVKGDKSRDVLRLEEELADALGATVEVRVKKRTKKGGQSGELAIHFDSLDALSGILDRLRGPAA